MNEQTKIPSIQSFDIDHLGIVASVVDEIGLVQQIDRLLGTHDQQHLSSGQLLKAMILNGLGFVSAPLYLFQEFFEGKATEHLIAPGVKPEHLNDDKLGRVLDNLFDADLTKVFVSCAMKAASRYGIDPQRSSMHLDSTSFHLHGDYETGEPRDEDHPEAAISITHGYSRDGRPDLKQFIVDLIVSADGDVPLFCRIADGNEADKAVFARLIRDFRSQVDLDTLFVADSALYSADSLRRMGDLRWLTRVPLTLAEAKRVLSEIEEDAFEESTLSGYRIAEVSSAAYAGIPQRWLIVESEARREAARLQLDRRLAKTEKHLKKRLNKLKKEDFECEGDARHGAEGFAGELRHHDLTELRITRELRHEKPGRPAKDARAREVYKVQGTLSRNEVLISKTLRNSGRFILATNEKFQRWLSKSATMPTTSCYANTKASSRRSGDFGF